MYLAVSKLKVVSVKEAEFERVWKTHKIDTDGIRGFKKFNLFKGNINKEFSLYIFYSKWNSENDFISSTKSDSFKLSHKKPHPTKKFVSGATRFWGVPWRARFWRF